MVQKLMSIVECLNLKFKVLVAQSDLRVYGMPFVTKNKLYSIISVLIVHAL